MKKALKRSRRRTVAAPPAASADPGVDARTATLIEELRPAAEALHKKRMSNRTVSTRMALDEAADLAPLRAATAGNDKAWRAACKFAGIAKRTAENLLSLKAFAESRKALFDVCACLGRTKLYHLARLPEEKLARLRPRRLAGMTDRELLAHLRDVAPAPMRKQTSRFMCHLVKLCVMAREEDTFQAMRRAELKGVYAKTQELFGAVKLAARNAA